MDSSKPVVREFLAGLFDQSCEGRDEVLGHGPGRERMRMFEPADCPQRRPV